ncbi:MAG TPA: zf-HC2 domain-containing protein [candidate division Zixibacteria bacterium]|nr:zf-HC2 domain-containing protein [candidate division Zixibacteria bacterium]
MKCAEARALFSPCLDRVTTGKQASALNEHLTECVECRVKYKSLEANRQVLASVRPKIAPPDLALRVQIAVSRELAASKRNPFEAIGMRLQNAVNAFMVPATAGALTAVVMFGLLIGTLIPRQYTGNDVKFYTPPQLSFAPFGLEAGSLNGDALVVEASIDAHGRVQDYRVISAPPDAEGAISELKNMLIFSQFRPATSFGQPVSGTVVLSFSKINVKG